MGDGQQAKDINWSQQLHGTWWWGCEGLHIGQSSNPLEEESVNRKQGWGALEYNQQGVWKWNDDVLEVDYLL